MRVVRTRFGRVWFPIYYGRCKMRTLQLQPEEQNNQHHFVLLLLLLLPLLVVAAADDDDDDDDGDDDVDKRTYDNSEGGERRCPLWS